VTPHVDIVIVSYRCYEHLERCLLSLREHESGPFRTVRVVDNASNDGTVERLRDSFPEVRLICAERNLGFGSATNLAIRDSVGEYVLALNPDTQLVEPVLAPLVELLEADQTLAVVGCRLELEDGTLDHAAKRSFPTVASALGHFSGLGRRAGARGAVAAYRAPEVERGVVDAVNGAFMLMRRRALDEVGLFDEGYWMYMEDLDLSYRLHVAGWRSWYEPSVRVVHVKGGVSGHPRPLRLNVAFHYGMARYYRKHYAPSRPAVQNVVVYAGIVIKLVASVVTSTVVRSRRLLLEGARRSRSRV
jgi:GT2 family glycosyltransferase